MRILVTGALGWIGKKVCMIVDAIGMDLIGFDLNVNESSGLKMLVGDLGVFREIDCRVCDFLGSIDIVIHCAGRAHRPIENSYERALFWKTNVEGTRDLIGACLRYGVKRIVYISTVAGYDWRFAADIGASELSQTRLETEYAKTKLEGERLVCESSLDWRVVRLATVFGGEDRANFSRMAKAMKRRRFIVPGNGSARKSVIPVELAAEAIVRMAVTDNLQHRLVNVGLPVAPSLRELCTAFSEQCGFPRAPSVPLPVLYSAARVGDLISKAWPSFPLSSMNVKKLTTSTVVDVRRFYENFPDFPRPSFAECLSQSASYYKAL